MVLSRALSYAVLSGLALLTLASQIPLHNAATPLGQYGPNSLGHQTSPWQFNFSSAAPHLFSSVYGLLKQWPQTFFPNGHAIAAAEIPAFTKMYHGRQDEDFPASPEWLAMDVYMAQLASHCRVLLTD